MMFDVFPIFDICRHVCLNLVQVSHIALLNVFQGKLSDDAKRKILDKCNKIVIWLDDHELPEVIHAPSTLAELGNRMSCISIVPRCR